MLVVLAVDAFEIVTVCGGVVMVVLILVREAWRKGCDLLSHMVVLVLVLVAVRGGIFLPRYRGQAWTQCQPV